MPALEYLASYNGCLVQSGERSRGREWIKPTRQRHLSDYWIVKKALTTRVVVGSVKTVSVFEPVERAIDASNYIRELREDWDGQVGRPYVSETLDRAIQFVREYAVLLSLKFGVIVSAPRILPGPDGSIDIHWKSDKHELLVNVPSNPEEPATFYGDDYGSVNIKGSFKLSSTNLGLIGWLAEHC